MQQLVVRLQEICRNSSLYSFKPSDSIYIEEEYENVQDSKDVKPSESVEIKEENGNKPEDPRKSEYSYSRLKFLTFFVVCCALCIPFIFDQHINPNTGRIDIESLESLAKEGDIKAMYELGVRLWYGIDGVRPHRSRSQELMKSAASKGFSEALKHASGGDAIAQVFVGQCFDEGWGVGKRCDSSSGDVQDSQLLKETHAVKMLLVFAIGMERGSPRIQTRLSSCSDCQLTKEICLPRIILDGAMSMELESPRMKRRL